MNGVTDDHSSFPPGLLMRVSPALLEGLADLVEERDSLESPDWLDSLELWDRLEFLGGIVGAEVRDGLVPLEGLLGSTVQAGLALPVVPTGLGFKERLAFPRSGLLLLERVE